MNKKAIVTHPVTLFMSGVVIGIILIVLITKGVINIPGITKMLCP